MLAKISNVQYQSSSLDAVDADWKRCCRRLVGSLDGVEGADLSLKWRGEGDAVKQCCGTVTIYYGSGSGSDF